LFIYFNKCHERIIAKRIEMTIMPAEWERQQCVLMSFPHEETDWHNPDNETELEASLTPFIRIAQAIAYGQAVYIICKDKTKISSLFCSTRNMTFIEILTNDTWVRDYGYISIKENADNKLLDFTFDGWGGKFEASLVLTMLSTELYIKKDTWERHP